MASRIAPAPPQATPQLLPHGQIGQPAVHFASGKEQAEKPGMRLPHFSTGMSEGSPKPGMMSNGMDAGAATEGTAEAVGLDDVAAAAVAL